MKDKTKFRVTIDMMYDPENYESSFWVSFADRKGMVGFAGAKTLPEAFDLIVALIGSDYHGNPEVQA